MGYFDRWFGLGKHYVPDFENTEEEIIKASDLGYISEPSTDKAFIPPPEPLPPEYVAYMQSLGPKMEAQGIFDLFKLTDKKVIDKITKLIEAIDVEKIEQIMRMVEVDEEGWLHIKIDLRIKK